MAASIRLTANFESNLESIRRFVHEAGAPQEVEALIDHLFEQVIPNLEAFPHLGRDFLTRSPESLEGQARYQRIKKALGSQSELREYISGDYLVLYALRANTVFLLSIRHHRQLSFDLGGFWR